MYIHYEGKEISLDYKFETWKISKKFLENIADLTNEMSRRSFRIFGYRSERVTNLTVG